MRERWDQGTRPRCEGWGAARLWDAGRFRAAVGGGLIPLGSGGAVRWDGLGARGWGVGGRLVGFYGRTSGMVGGLYVLLARTRRLALGYVDDGEIATRREISFGVVNRGKD